MKLIDSMVIRHENPWEPELDGLFREMDGTVKFFYKENQSVVAQTLEGKREVWYTAPEGKRLELPRYWAGVMKGLHPTMQVWRPDDPIPVYIGKYKITSPSQWSYLCERDGEEVWRFKGYAWRYTVIDQYLSNIYFGTAGQGGYFYMLNLHTGEPLLKLKTGGTVHISARRGERLYLLQQDKKAYLVCIDLKDGTILERLELPGKADMHSAIALLGDTVHAVTFTYKGGPVKDALWNRVEV